MKVAKPLASGGFTQKPGVQEDIFGTLVSDGSYGLGGGCLRGL